MGKVNWKTVGYSLILLVWKRRALSSLALLCFPLSLLFFLYKIPSLSKESYSLYLIILFILYMYAGIFEWVIKKENAGLWHNFPFVVGFIGLLLSPWYSLDNISLLVIIQVIYSFHFYQIYFLQNLFFRDKRRPEQKLFLNLSHFSAFSYLLIFILQGCPINFFYLALALAYSFVYFKIAWQNEFEAAGERSISAYLLGLFVNIAFFEALLIHAPIYEISWYLILTIPLLWLLFWLGYWARHKGWSALGKSLYEIQFLTILLAFLLPLQLHNYSIDFICMMSFGYLFSMLLFSLITDDQRFLFPLILIMAFLYYYLVPKDQISPGGMNLLFLLPSFIFLVQGMWLQKRNSSLAEIFYFGWIVMTGFFMVTMAYNSSFSLYGLAIYTLLYCLAYLYSINNFPGLGKAFYWAVNVLSMTVIILWFSNQSQISGVFLGLILLVGHLFIAYRTKKIFHIYAACLALAGVYYLGFLTGKPWGLILIYTFPLALIVYGCSFWAKPFLPWSREGFKLAGHFGVALFTLLAVMNSKVITTPWLFLSLFIYTLGYFILSYLSPSYEYFFLTSTFFSLSFYFGLQKVPDISSSVRLQYFSLCPFLLGLIGYFVKIKRGESGSQPIFEVSVLATATSSFIPIFYGNTEVAQKLLFLSIILYIFIAYQTKKGFYIYLATLTLGLITYNYFYFSHQRFMQNIVIYSIYLVVFLGLLFFSSPSSCWPEEDNSSDQGAIRGWKKVFAYSILLSSFPCLLIPLYTKKLITYPGFCGRCHYMGRYVDAWQKSSHREASCIRCHYEPLNLDTAPSIEEREGQLASLAKSLALAYNFFPKSEVSDQACLQQGCHSWQQIKKEISFQEKGKFNHEQHMRSSTQGKCLRCITCHSQLVQGKQQRVTENICFDCHTTHAN